MAKLLLGAAKCQIYLWSSGTVDMLVQMLIHFFQVPIYIISSVAEELVAFLNVIPEWLCKQQQDKVF